MVERLTITTPSDREIMLSRVFQAPRALVFRALTEPELLKEWLFGPEGWTLPECEVDLRPGGSFRYVWRKAGGGASEAGEPEDLRMSGVFREVVPPERTVHTELFDPDWTGGEAVVTTVLAESGGKTTMTMTVLYQSKEGRDQALQSGMDEGLNASYERLDAVLAKTI